jgi:Ca2+-binding RTX toxin-like protein
MSRITLRHLFSRVARRPASPRTTLRVECLEERRNPVTGIRASFGLDFILRVNGDSFPSPTVNSNDILWVLKSDIGIQVFDRRFNTFVPIADSFSGTFVASVDSGSVAGIVVNGNGGNDLLDLNSDPKFFGGVNYQPINDIPTTITGGAGNDSISGSDGNDTIRGAEGDDQIFGNDRDDVIDGGGGTDRIFGDDNGVVKSGNDSIVGGAQSDILHGGPGTDTILAGAGDDKVYGDNGNDWLYGEEDNDTLSGGTGLGGGDGADHIFGDADVVGGVGSGGSGNDWLFGERSSDTLDGGPGDDRLTGGGENDTLIGSTGNDTLLGGDGGDSLLGGSGADSLNGGTGNDTLNSLPNDGFIDSLNGGGGTDDVYFPSFVDPDVVVGRTQTSVTASLDASGVLHVNGSNGTDDRITITRSGDFIWVTGNHAGAAGQRVLIQKTDGSAVDRVRATSVAGVIADGGDGNDAINASTVANTPQGVTLRGGAGDDTLTGGASPDTIEGGAGNDRLIGGGGSNMLFGFTAAAPTGPGDGNDLIIGGVGADVIFGGDGNDTVNGGAGVDQIDGNAGNDSLLGSTGDDIINGGVGADTLNGGLGIDHGDGGVDADVDVAISIEFPTNIP